MRTISYLLLVVGLLALAGCKDKGASQNTSEVVIGEFASLTGDTADFGRSSHEGLMLAVEQINAAGGVLGKPMRVVTTDDRSDADEAVTAVQKLISRDRVVAVIGEVASKRSLAGGNVCQSSQIPMLSPASTNPLVTAEDGRVRDWVFRICFTDDYQGGIGGKFAIEQGWKRVAILTNLDEDYSKGLAKYFKTAYQGSGQIVADETFSKDDRDFKAQLERIKQAKPDAVYVPAYYQAVILIVTQAKEVGLNVPFFGGDGWDSPLTLKAPAAQGNYYSDHFSAEEPRPEVQQFVKAYETKYQRVPDAMAVLGYDAGRVMADAIRRAGKTDAAAIRDALSQTKDFVGASGSITIDTRHNARKPIVILQIAEGKAKLLKTYPPQ